LAGKIGIFLKDTHFKKGQSEMSVVNPGGPLGSRRQWVRSISLLSSLHRLHSVAFCEV